MSRANNNLAPSHSAREPRALTRSVGNILASLFAMSFWAFPLPSSAWETWIYDGKTGLVTNDIPGSESIRAAYEKSLPVLCPWKTDPRHEDCLKLDLLEESTNYLGDWEGFAIAQVVMSNQFHQAVLLRDSQSGWHFIFIQFGIWNQYSLGIPPEVWNVSGVSVLANRLPIDGSGGFLCETYWILDSETGQPRLLDLTAIREAEKQVLPPCGIVGWKSGLLDMRALTYWTSVWMPGDGNCCPTGGSIEMSLAIEGNRVVVTDARWIPPEEHD